MAHRSASLVACLLLSACTPSGTAPPDARGDDSDASVAPDASAPDAPTLPAEGLQVFPLRTPTRLFDTREAAPRCGATRLAPGASFSVRLAECAGEAAPAGARALAGTLTVYPRAGSGAGAIQVLAQGADSASTTLEFEGPDRAATGFTVRLGAEGGFTLRTTGALDADVVVDAMAVYAPPGPGGLYVHLFERPMRLIDTRQNAVAAYTAHDLIAAGEVLRLSVNELSHDGQTLPIDVRGLMGTLTVLPQGLSPEAGGSVSVLPGDAPVAPAATTTVVCPPETYFPREFASNFVVGLSPSQQLTLTAADHDFQVVVDLVAYLSENPEGALRFFPLEAPVRLIDSADPTRGALPMEAGPLRADTFTAQLARFDRGGARVPDEARAIGGVLHLRNHAAGTFGAEVSVHARGALTRAPLTQSAVANPSARSSVGFATRLDGAGAFEFYPSRPVDVAVEVTGYFAP
jgi:hypothetical protein